jgi:DNA-3-methyladenine glycosylase II
MTSAPHARLEMRGPFDLAQVAVMGFGNRDDVDFDGTMRLAFCLDGDYERHVGVEVRQTATSIDLHILVPTASRALNADETGGVSSQVARILSLDHDGEAFQRLCETDPALAAVRASMSGFRPLLFHSPYEAAVCAIVSARRSRRQGLAILARLAEHAGVTIDLAGTPTPALPTPTQLLTVTSSPGIAAARIPQLHAVAHAAISGQLDAGRLHALPRDEAMLEVQRLPGIGPSYSSLIVERACGHTDIAPSFEPHTRRAVEQVYQLTDIDEPTFAKIVDSWRPFRTWVLVMVRSFADRADAIHSHPHDHGADVCLT